LPNGIYFGELTDGIYRLSKVVCDENNSGKEYILYKEFEITETTQKGNSYIGIIPGTDHGGGAE